MVIGVDGHLYVLIHDNFVKTTSVHDVTTGREISSWGDTPHYPHVLCGGMIGSILEKCDKGWQLREIPSGKKRQQVPSNNRVASSIVLESHIATPDGRTLAVVDGKIRKYTDGQETKFALPANEAPTISPDGRTLGAVVHQAHSYGALSNIRDGLGLDGGNLSFFTT